MDITRIKYLLGRYNHGELTKNEWEEFRNYLASDDFLSSLSDDMMKTFSNLRKPDSWEELKHSDRNVEETISLAHVKASPVIGWRKHWSWIAAAVVVIVSSTFFVLNRDNNHTSEKIIAEQAVELKDITPATDRATLTLSDGSTINLDSASSGTLAKQGSSIVEKMENGQIVYSSSAGTQLNKILYNTMTTPKGGRFTLILPDGSKVWLNAASSITYPTSFAGGERRVSITGEVYFEVAPDKTHPFVVNTAKESIMVLGTHFNVNAYSDESAVKTSLVEGKVKIGEHVLRPGEAFMDGNVFVTNISQDVAWKNGVFDFDDVEFAAGMRQLARWYDLEIQYHIAVPGIRFGGKIDRNLTLSQVLKVIDGVGAHFELEGKVLHVKN